MKKVIAVVLDGFGIRDEVEGNAVKQAVLPNFKKLWEEYPHTLLNASGQYVGLPEGQFGNSEVGHMALGSGRLIKQKETVIDEMFENKSYDKNEDFIDTIEYIKENNVNTHLMILCSDGGVHSHMKHLVKMLEVLKEKNIENVYMHLITDGRDTGMYESYKFIENIEKSIKKIGVGKIATVCGRYYAMDRDNKWERTKEYYDLITRGVGLKSKSVMQAIKSCYQKDLSDEFLPPILLDETGLIKDNDVLFWLNHRPDRAKQILNTLTNPKFSEFKTVNTSNLKLITLYPVDSSLNYKHLLENALVENAFGVYIGDLGLTQARIAETEKFAHVTNFFDGEYQGKVDNCDRFLIPSPKVDTYDLKPEMSAVDVCKKAVNCMEKDYDFILVNFANPDMVGHTGNMVAAIKAVQVVDLCLGKIIESAEENFYTIFLVADHGNADIMSDEEGNPVTTHTSSPVPFVVTDKKLDLVPGDITSFAPTILKYMDIAIPKEMKETKILFKESKESN